MFQESDIENLKHLISEFEIEKAKWAQSVPTIHDEPKEVEPTTQESASPEQDFFEMIDDVKSRGSSETKSIQSNGDWTKINEVTKNYCDGRRDDISLELKEELRDDDNETMTYSNDQEGLDGELDHNTIESKDNGQITLSDIIIPRVIPEAFKKEIFKCCDISYSDSEDILSEFVAAGELSELSVETFVEILSLYLQKIIPNIILNKREVSAYYICVPR